MNVKVKSDIQKKADRYLQLHALLKKVEAEMKPLRKELEEYMDSKNLMVIAGTEGGAISRRPSNRAITTSQFTTYDLNDISMYLPDDVKKEAVKTVVDKDVVEGYVKLGKVPQEVMRHKRYKQVITFNVNK